MTTTAEKIAVMQAFERGETVEFYAKTTGEWRKAITPTWNWLGMEYRIAPKPIDLVEVLEFCSGYMHRDFKDDLMGHAWTDIIARAKEFQG